MTTIIVPCFNEAARLNTSEFLTFLKAEEDTNFLFVDDGSTDSTRKTLQQLAVKQPDRVSYTCLKHNRGKAEAVRQGILLALEGDDNFIGFWDADLATPLSEIPRLTNQLQTTPQLKLVCGARIKKLGAVIDRRRYRHYFGRIIATLISYILRLPVYDTQCGAKLFDRSLVQQIFKEPFISPWLFDVELFARIIGLVGRAKASKIIYELPLLSWKDIGESKIKLRYLPKIPLELARINFRYRRELNIP